MTLARKAQNHSHELPRSLPHQERGQFCTTAGISNPNSKISRNYFLRVAANCSDLGTHTILRNGPAILQDQHSPINERGSSNRNYQPAHGGLS